MTRTAKIKPAIRAGLQVGEKSIYRSVARSSLMFVTTPQFLSHRLLRRKFEFCFPTTGTKGAGERRFFLKDSWPF